MRSYRWLAGRGLSFALLAAAPATQAQQVLAGGQEFHAYCAPCHGEDARGVGPKAKELPVKPADLTKLAARNHGKLPADEVAETIDGRTKARIHGSAMPIWGTHYEAQVGGQYGPYGSEIEVKNRIQALVRYLSSIQTK